MRWKEKRGKHKKENKLTLAPSLRRVRSTRVPARATARSTERRFFLLLLANKRKKRLSFFFHHRFFFFRFQFNASLDSPSSRFLPPRFTPISTLPLRTCRIRAKNARPRGNKSSARAAVELSDLDEEEADEGPLRRCSFIIMSNALAVFSVAGFSPVLFRSSWV